jgi:hypothetical protein
VIEFNEKLICKGCRLKIGRSSSHDSRRDLEERKKERKKQERRKTENALAK